MVKDKISAKFCLVLEKMAKLDYNVKFVTNCHVWSDRGDGWYVNNNAREERLDHGRGQ
jgi:hypothetical protein